MFGKIKSLFSSSKREPLQEKPLESEDEEDSSDENEPNRQDSNAYFRTMLSMKALELDGIKPVLDKCSNRIWAALIECEQELKEQYDERAKLISMLPSSRGKDVFQKQANSFESVDLYADDDDPKMNKGSGHNLASLFEDFWLSVLSNHAELNSHIEKWDKPVLRYLKDVRFETDVKNAYKIKIFQLILFFDPNPFFRNGKLVKSFYITIAANPFSTKTLGQIRTISSKGCSIDWKNGMDVTVDETGKVRDSLFNYFFDFIEPDREDAKAQKQIFQEHVGEFNLALVVRKLIPEAISRFIQGGEPIVTDDAESTISEECEIEKEKELLFPNNAMEFTTKNECQHREALEYDKRQGLVRRPSLDEIDRHFGGHLDTDVGTLPGRPIMYTNTATNQDRCGQSEACLNGKNSENQELNHSLQPAGQQASIESNSDSESSEESPEPQGDNGLQNIDRVDKDEDIQSTSVIKEDLTMLHARGDEVCNK